MITGLRVETKGDDTRCNCAQLKRGGVTSTSIWLNLRLIETV